MKHNEKLPCHVVRDLMPNSVEGLVSEETNGLVQTHLEDCSDCRTVFDVITRKEEGVDENGGTLEAGVQYLKKIKRRNRMKILSAAAAVFVVLFAAVWVYMIQEYPILARDVEVTNLCRLSDGSIYYEITVKGPMGPTIIEVDDNGVETTHYAYYLRDKWLDEKQIFVQHTLIYGDDEVKERYYEGLGEHDRLLIWDGKSELPKASSELEASLPKLSENTEYAGATVVTEAWTTYLP